MYFICCPIIPTAEEGESALSVSAFYGWLDWVKRLVETVGLNPKGENGTSRKISFVIIIILGQTNVE